MYLCLSLGLEVELTRAARGVAVSYHTFGAWSLSFGRLLANMLKRCRPRPGEKWPMRDVFITIYGKRYYPLHAVDQDGHMVDVLVQSRCSSKDSMQFFRKLLKGFQYDPLVIMKDKLKGYGAAKGEILPTADLRQSHYLNN